MLLSNVGLRSFSADSHGSGGAQAQQGSGFGSPNDPSQRLGQLPSLGSLSLDISSLGGFGGLWGTGQGQGQGQGVPAGAAQAAVGNSAPGTAPGRGQPMQQPLQPSGQPAYSLYSGQAYTPFAQQQQAMGMYLPPQQDPRTAGPNGAVGPEFPRGPGLGSSSSDFDLAVDAASGLSPNAPSFNPTVLNGLMGLYGPGLQPGVQMAPGLMPRGVPGPANLPASLGGIAQTLALPPGPVLGDRDLVSITLTARCACLLAAQTQCIKVVSTTFGGWDLDHALVMQRAVGANNQEVWSLSFQVPRASTRFVYKYGAVDVMGRNWEELGQPRAIPLQSVRLGQDVHVEDLFDQAMPVY